MTRQLVGPLCISVGVFILLLLEYFASVTGAPAPAPQIDADVVTPVNSKIMRVKNIEEKADLFEGDIILSDDQERAINIAAAARVALSGIVGEKYRWEERVVHYEISSDYEVEDRELIEGAMEELADKTCVRFQERDGEDDYLKIEDGNGCSSKVGKRGGEQTVTLSRNGCMKHGVAIHEIVHALGFWHEQSRTDRDNYVDIIWKNILPGKYNNFKKYLRAEIYDYQVPYDYNSVMHYKADAFKRDDTDEDTIVPKDAKAEIGQREGLSELDARKINLMYCPELVKNGTYTPVTGSGEDGDGGDGEGEGGSEGGDEEGNEESESSVNDVKNRDSPPVGVGVGVTIPDSIKSNKSNNKSSEENKNQSRSSINLIPTMRRKTSSFKISQMSSGHHIVSSFISANSFSRELLIHS